MMSILNSEFAGLPSDTLKCSSREPIDVCAVLNDLLRTETTKVFESAQLPSLFSCERDFQFFQEQSELERAALTPLLQDISNNPSVALHFTATRGRAIVARRAIEKGQQVTVLDSPGLISRADIVKAFAAIESGALNPAARKIIYDCLQVGEDALLLPTLSVGFLLNHSCAPNVVLIEGSHGFEFKSLRRIESGEEIAWNYSTSIGDWYVMQCRCDSPACCGVAASPKAMSVTARQNLLGYFGEKQLLPHVVTWLNSEDCPVEFSASRFLEAFDGEASKREQILTQNPTLHPEIGRRVRAALHRLAA